MTASDRTPEQWESFLEDHPDLVLMCLDNDMAIHEFEHDDYKDQISFLAYGSQGYDLAGSRRALEVAVTGPVKVVPRDQVRAERERLVGEHYATAEDWAADTIDGVCQ